MLKPDQIQQALVMREAGYPVATIAEEVGASVTALKVHFKKYGAKRGSLNKELIESTRKNLLSDLSEENSLTAKIAASVSSDLVLSNKLHEVCYELLEELNAAKKLPITARSRSLAAIAQTLSSAQSLYRKALNVERFTGTITQQTEPVKLIITGMSEPEEEELRARTNAKPVEPTEDTGEPPEDFEPNFNNDDSIILEEA